jgi:hypothetical protein
MATESKICGTAAMDSSVGTVDIANVEYITTDDTSYATIAEITTDHVAGVYSHRIKCSNFGFTIPDGSTITNIQAFATGNANYYSPDGGETEYGTRPTAAQWIDESGALIGYQSGANPWIGALGEREIDINGWDVISPADARNTNFGVVFQMFTNTYHDSGQWWIDFVRILITYTPPAGPALLKTVNGLAKASVKTRQGLAIASIKTWNGLA